MRSRGKEAPPSLGLDLDFGGGSENIEILDTPPLEIAEIVEIFRDLIFVGKKCAKFTPDRQSLDWKPDKARFLSKKSAV
jgi:hypothetical protein